MPEPVVIIGAGQAGVQTAFSLRDMDYSGEITLLNGENFLPYQRPPLSKSYLKNSVTDSSLIFRNEQLYESKQIEIMQASTAIKINRQTKSVSLTTGEELPYGKLVIATGARNRILPFDGGELKNVFQLRGLEDAKRLRLELQKKPKIAVIGGGFIGLEFASIAKELGAQVTIVEAASRVMARAVCPTLSDYVQKVHLARGIEILLAQKIVAINSSSDFATDLQMHDGSKLPCELVLVSVGIIPNSELAEAAGLTVSNGIQVDATLHTSDPDIFAIGDCACFPSDFSGRNIRLESVQNAVDQAKTVAENICGTSTEYGSIPWFWSDQSDLKIQIAGLTSNADTTVVSGDPATGKFSVCCFTNNRFVGVESINHPADHMAARRLLAAGRKITVQDISHPGATLKSLAKS
ncbi:FAD-dependent oxidoreductase [Sneathiella marina]|uniref:FAD-dependent oxidoreductase n=1 Tax=Sneathiella marina TaxID=2950108 RepID=A0ABY4VZX5_9PROT|nr:FAD-dependent oxidoreductase [Sneathiella marina]USG60485.1 FAD-dependent oxidoreductase [Sneathiella marina]